MAEVSSVVRTIGDAYPTTQVYDVYLLALENMPGWWVYMDPIQPFIEATFTDLETRNPGLEFRTHWITKTGYGRDEQYAPYTNETRHEHRRTRRGPTSTRPRCRRQRVRALLRRPNGFGPASTATASPPRVPERLPASEAYTDSNSNGQRDPGEPYTDCNGNGDWDMGNAVPYALADQHNHAMRWPDEDARFAARVAAGLEADDTPTSACCLDRMIAEPTRTTTRS